MGHETLIIDAKPGAPATVTLNRPEAANAINTPLALELKDFFAELPAGCRSVILTGGGKHFSAGADLKSRNGMDKAAWLAQHKAFREALSALLSCPVPVIAAVNGAAFGGGLELALACDFIYASEEAKFALTEATLGIMPGMGGTQTLPRAVGSRRAKECLFTGQVFSAGEAYGWGMVNKLCAAASLMPEAFACAKKIGEGAPLAVKAIKKSVNQGIALPLEEALACELSHYNTLLETKDRHEGISAWGEKRKPVFKGE